MSVLQKISAELAIRFEGTKISAADIAEGLRLHHRNSVKGFFSRANEDIASHLAEVAEEIGLIVIHGTKLEEGYTMTKKGTQWYCCLVNEGYYR